MAHELDEDGVPDHAGRPGGRGAGNVGERRSGVFAVVDFERLVCDRAVTSVISRTEQQDLGTVADLLGVSRAAVREDLIARDEEVRLIARPPALPAPATRPRHV